MDPVEMHGERPDLAEECLGLDRGAEHPPELAADHDEGDPREVADEHRARQEISQEPQSSDPPEQADPTEEQRQCRAQGGVAAAASGAMAMAVISAVVDSGPTESCRDDPNTA